MMCAQLCEFVLVRLALQLRFAMDHQVTAQCAHACSRSSCQHQRMIFAVAVATHSNAQRTATTAGVFMGKGEHLTMPRPGSHAVITVFSFIHSCAPHLHQKHTRAVSPLATPVPYAMLRVPHDNCTASSAHHHSRTRYRSCLRHHQCSNTAPVLLRRHCSASTCSAPVIAAAAAAHRRRRRTARARRAARASSSASACRPRR
jgi:hypothetical protein